MYMATHTAAVSAILCKRVTESHFHLPDTKTPSPKATTALASSVRKIICDIWRCLANQPVSKGAVSMFVPIDAKRQFATKDAV
jgi:hypothetical protein